MKKIFAVKDLAVQAFGLPFFVRSQGEAQRSFQDEANSDRTKSAIAQHPEDYELHYLGEYDEQTGLIKTNHLDGREETTLIARAKDLLTTGN